MSSSDCAILCVRRHERGATVEDILRRHDPIPDYYVDSVRIGTGLYTFVLELGVQETRDEPGSEPLRATPLARVRMSPQHALILSKLLRKNVNAYLERVGPIAIPDQVYIELGIPKED